MQKQKHRNGQQRLQEVSRLSSSTKKFSRFQAVRKKLQATEIREKGVEKTTSDVQRENHLN